MDANGLRFWMLSQHDDWIPSTGSQTLSYCRTSHRLHLRSVSNTAPPAEDFNTAAQLVEAVPMARDQFGNYARWDGVPNATDNSVKHIVAGGSGPQDNPLYKEIPIYASPEAVSDLAMGYDGILYVARKGKLVLIDRRGRWQPYALSDPNFQFWRLIALPQGGVLALDRTNSAPQLARVAGQPLPEGPQDVPDVGIMRGCDPPDPPRIVARYTLPNSEVFVAFCAMDSGGLALLSWKAATNDNTVANIRLFSEASGLKSAVQVSALRWPYAIAWIGEQKLAVLATNSKEAFIFDLLDATSTLVPTGDTYVLRDRNVGPFVHTFEQPPYYADGTDVVPLLPLSLSSFASSGLTDVRVFDGGTTQTVWHRLFLEAVIPSRCGIVVWLAASDKREELDQNGTADWFPHFLGTIDASMSSYQLPTTLNKPLPSDVPRLVWQGQACEVPFAAAMLDNPVANQRGLFMTLAQRAAKVVRSLRGRYLGIRTLLAGDSRNTPEIAALRIYASRFSYVEHYLPQIYHEQKFGDEANKSGGSTRRDFFERFVDIFEAQFTRIEDHIANAYLLSRPESAANDSLDWLGSWIGLDPTGYPPDRRRARLLAAPELYRGKKKAPGGRGTADGITQALNVATDGLCDSGAIVVIENFRLRHIFATILGADLAIQNDPLLPDYSGSSNSIVGDTLFLGDPKNKDFLVLFAAAVQTPTEKQQVQTFYDQLAHRITIFVHDQVEAVNFKLVQTIVEQEKPAHVMAAVVRAVQPLMIGLASLLGINTYLAPQPPRGTATIDVSQIGRYDVITHIPSLDPRLESGPEAAQWDAPVARLGAPQVVSAGQPISLDGSASTAPEGANLTNFDWKLSNS